MSGRWGEAYGMLERRLAGLASPYIIVPCIFTFSVLGTRPAILNSRFYSNTSSSVIFRRKSDKMLLFYRVAAQNYGFLLSFNARFSMAKGESYFFTDGACVWVRRDCWLYSKYR